MVNVNSSYVNCLNPRGVLIAVVDGLKAFLSQCYGSGCIVHLIRNHMSLVPWKDRKVFFASIKTIYCAENADAPFSGLRNSRPKWGTRYPASCQI